MLTFFVRLIIILIPFAKVVTVYEHYLSSVSVLSVLLFCLLFARISVQGKSFLFSRTETYLIFFLGISALSLTWGTEFRESSKQIFDLLASVLFVLAMPRLLSGLNAASLIRRDLVIVGMIQAFIGVGQVLYPSLVPPQLNVQSLSSPDAAEKTDVQTLLEQGAREVRGSGTFENANQFAFYLILPLGLSVAAALRGRRLTYIISTGIIAAGIAVSFSRGGYFLAVFTSLLILYFHGFSLKRLFRYFLVISFCTFIFLYYLTDLFPTITNMFDPANEDTLFSNIRYTYWMEGIRLFLSAPFIGYGFASVGLQGGTEFGFDPHNSYILLLCNEGLLGFISLVLLLKSVFRNFAASLKDPESRDFGIEVFFAFFIASLLSFAFDGLIFRMPFVYFFPLAMLSFLQIESFRIEAGILALCAVPSQSSGGKTPSD